MTRAHLDDELAAKVAEEGGRGTHGAGQEGEVGPPAQNPEQQGRYLSGVRHGTDEEKGQAKDEETGPGLKVWESVGGQGVGAG